MPFLKTKDLEIYHKISGQGEPVVLIGGLTSTVVSWKYQQEELEKYYQVILFDNRGSGQTRVLSSPKLSMELFAADLLDLLNGLGIERAHVLGASMGGMIAQLFAYAHPDRCLSLILCCTTCGLESGVPAQPEVVELMLNRHGISEEEGERRALQAVAHPSSFHKRQTLLDFYLQTKLLYPHSVEEIARRNEAIRAFDFRNKLREIKVPTLIMHGADDKLVPPANANLLAQHIPGSELILIKDSAHIFFIEEFEEFNKSLLDFLRRHPAVGNDV